MANVIIKDDERRSQIDQTLKDYGINPSSASKEQRDMADCISRKTGEAIQNMRRR